MILLNVVDGDKNELKDEEDKSADVEKGDELVEP